MNPNQQKIKSSDKIMILFGIFLTAVFGYYFAGCFHEKFTFAEMIKNYESVIEQPFRNYLNSYTVPCIVGAELVYVVVILAYLTSRRNLMPGKEFGTMTYESPQKLNRRLADQNNSIHDPENIMVPIMRRKKKWIFKRKK